jgi:cytoskeletal protein CcmA (bactofilin family)
MKLLGSSAKPQPSRSSGGGVDTLIGRHTEVLGDIRFNGGLHIDGSVKGKVIALQGDSATLSVSETGSVEGDVRVATVVLNGCVTGDVYASAKITLAPRARVTGNVYYKILEMQGGSQVNGQLVHDAGETLRSALSNQSGSATDTTVIDVREVRLVNAAS